MNKIFWAFFVFCCLIGSARAEILIYPTFIDTDTACKQHVYQQFVASHVTSKWKRKTEKELKTLKDEYFVKCVAITPFIINKIKTLEVTQDEIDSARFFMEIKKIPMRSITFYDTLAAHIELKCKKVEEDSFNQCMTNRGYSNYK